MQKDFQFTATVWKSKNGFWCGFANEIDGVNCQSETLDDLKIELKNVAKEMILENSKTAIENLKNSKVERKTLILQI
jgi:predicted RNase H-like HicB family nuclease